MSDVTVLIADDHPLFRQGLRAALDAADGVVVVAEAADGADCVRLAIEHTPDVVLMDIQMPSLSGVEATRRILDAAPEINVLVLTMFDDDSSVFAAVRAGAKGYVLKGADEQDIERAVRTVARGDAVFGGAIAARLASFFDANRRHPFPELTQREREVLDLLAQGLNNSRIAEELGLSLKTVRNNLSSIFTKLRVVDRAQAMLKARASGLGEA